MNKSALLLSKSSVLIAALSLFAGCNNPFSAVKEATSKASISPTKEAVIDTSSDKTGSTLCSINGKPVISENDFNKGIAQVLQSNPFFRGAGGANALPMAIKRKFLDEMVKQELIIADAQKQNIEEDPAFLKELEEVSKLVKRSLIVQFFEKKIFENIKVTDSDVKKHYEENKERYVKVAGGVLVSSASFENEAAADDFVNKAPKNLEEFEKQAKEIKDCKFNDHGRIGKDSRGEMGVEVAPKALKSAVLEVKEYPAVGKVKVGKTFHVFCAADPKQSEYFELDEIRQQIEGLLKNNMFRDKLEEKLKVLNSSFDITINEDFFKEKESAATNQEDGTPVDAFASIDDLDDEDSATAA